MPGSRLLCLVLLAVAACAGEAWRPAEHPATVLRPLAGLTRARAVVACAPEVGGRLTDPGPPLGTTIPPGAQVVLDDALARAELAVAAAAVAQAGAEAAFRAREARRIEELFAQQRVSEGERDAAAHAAAAAALALDAARAQEARAGIVLARHHVTLPVGWQVLRRLRETGAVLQPGEAVLEAGDLAGVVVVLHLGEDEIAALPAATASVGGTSLPIVAVRAAQSADPATRKRPVEVELPGAAGGGREALFVLRLPDPAGALLVPEALLRAEPDGRFARTADGRRLRVTVLRAGEGGVAVLPTPELAAAALVAW